MERIPCPLNDAHCAVLQRILDTAPQVLELVKDCEDCEVSIPGAKESIERSLEIARKLQDKVHKWRQVTSQ